MLKNFWTACYCELNFQVENSLDQILDLQFLAQIFKNIQITNKFQNCSTQVLD